MPVVCPSCGSDEDLNGTEMENGQIHVICGSCSEEWTRGEARRVYKTAQSVDDLHSRFPSPDSVTPEGRKRADALKATFLNEHPAPKANVEGFWELYTGYFSADGLDQAPDQAFKDFANSNIGANPGNMSVFNIEWNDLGAEVAATKVRDAIRYLLYGTQQAYVEDRFTTLLTPEYGMKGFREALLTKVLCIVEPDRFIPIVKYTGVAGKREIAQAVYGLKLPSPDTVSWTTGRLVFWSNDLLRNLLGDGFETMEHASEFLWWAKSQP